MTLWEYSGSGGVQWLRWGAVAGLGNKLFTFVVLLIDQKLKTIALSVDLYSLN
jgi:hypothetical protein